MVNDVKENETITIFAKVYSPRWGHDDTYTITLTRNKLSIYLDTRGAECVLDQDGQAEWQGYRSASSHPLLAILANDSIYAPAVVPEALEWALGKWCRHEADRVEISAAIEELFSWVSFTARQKPASDFWKEYF